MPVLIEGNPALIIVDIMGTGRPEDDYGGIPTMGGGEERVDRVIPLIETARANNVPVIYIIEVHRPDHVDFGRELDGDESVHCVEGHPGTRIHIRLPYPRRGRLFDPETPLLGLLRNRFPDPSQRPQGRHVVPVRRPDRRLRPLHLRRRTPARLSRTRDRGLRRRFQLGGSYRFAQCHGVSPAWARDAPVPR